MGILIQVGQICVLIALLSDERGKRLKKYQSTICYSTLIGGKMRELEKHNPKIFNSDLVNLWSKTLRNNFNNLGRLLKQKLAIAFRLLLNGFWVLKSPQTLLYIK